jgi:Protein of unknown function (DUF4232)
MSNAELSAAASSARAGAAAGRIRIRAAVAMVALGGAAMCGCSAASHAAGPAATARARATAVARTGGASGAGAGVAAAAATATATPSATPAALASPAAAVTPAAAMTPPPSATPVGPAPCLSRYLAAKAGVAQGTPGSTYQVIDFTNLDNVSCTLYGYPGVSLAGGMPVTQIGLAAAEGGTTPRELVTLAPGGVANALLQIVHSASYPASTCGPVTASYLQIFPPNQTVPIYLGYASPACSKPVQILTVSVVQPGPGSSS